MTFPPRLRALLRDTSGLALIEFAYAMPLLLGVGLSGIEISNLALTHMRVSQAALTVADNASRVGVNSALSVQQLRESDINDVLMGAEIQGRSFKLTRNGRVTVSSVQVNADGGQTIFWQRCVGVKAGSGYDSSYGVQGVGATGTGFPGMGPPTRRVSAPPNSAVIYVEVNYDYTPIADFGLITGTKLHYVASFVVRDNRDLTQVYNPNPTAVAQTCGLHNATVPR